MWQILSPGKCLKVSQLPDRYVHKYKAKNSNSNHSFCKYDRYCFEKMFYILYYHRASRYFWTSLHLFFLQMTRRSSVISARASSLPTATFPSTRKSMARSYIPVKSATRCSTVKTWCRSITGGTVWVSHRGGELCFYKGNVIKRNIGVDVRAVKSCCVLL